MVRIKLLITGANGLLGQSLIHVNNGRFDICATAIGESIYDTNRILFKSMDILNSDDIDIIFSEFKPDIVIHGAAMTNVDKCEANPIYCKRVNVDGTQNIIDACEKYSAHLIFISTDFIFDGKIGSYSETAKENPLSVYGKSKFDAEKLIQSSNCKWTIARTSLVMGYFPHLMSSNIILWARKKLAKGDKINVVDDQVRTPTWSIDLAEGCLLIAKNKSLGIYNISGSDKFSIIELVRQVAIHGDFDLSLIDRVDSLTLGQLAMRPLISDLDISKAKKDLGFKPHSFREVLDAIPYI